MFSHQRVFLSALIIILSVSNVWADATARDHAPIGVMGDHLHKQGEWMTSYRYMQMDMDSNYRGSDEISTSDVLSEFMVAPTRMEMYMHMVGVMYGLNDRVTLMAMLPYVEMTMDHVTRMGAVFSTQSSGIGDMKFSGLISVLEEEGHKLHLNMGFSVPTGSIKAKDATPADSDAVLPYPMQIGSGTFDLLPGITYNGYSNKLSWGAQFMTTQRLGENDRNYTLGDRYELSSWMAYELADWISASFRAKKLVWRNVDGAAPGLNPNMVQTADPDRIGGKRLDLLFGINLIGTEDNWLHGHRLAMEFGFPVDVQLNGPQLNADWNFTVGWQKAF